MDTRTSPPESRDSSPAKLSVLGLADLTFLASELERAFRLISEGRERYTSNEDDAAAWQSLEEDLNDATALLRTFAFPTSSPEDENLVPPAAASRAASFNCVAHSARKICFLVELAHAKRAGTFSVEWLRRNAPPVLDGEAPWLHLMRATGTGGAEARTDGSLEGNFLRAYPQEALHQLGGLASGPLFTQRCARLGAAVVRIAGIAFLKRVLRHAEGLQDSGAPEAPRLLTAEPLLAELCEALMAWRPPESAPTSLAANAQAALAALGLTPPRGGWDEYTGE